MASWLTEQIYTNGYWGIALLMFLENIFPPIPSEAIMPLAGYAATKASLILPAVIAAGTAGSVLGALPLYYLGRVMGESRLRRWVDRYGRWLGVDSCDVDRAKDWFDRYGLWAVFLCRVVPGVRSFISIPAGLNRMRPAPFLFLSASGMLLWTSFLAYLGHTLGANFRKVEQYLDPVSYLVLGAVVVLYLFRAFRRRRCRSEGASGADEGP